MRYFQVKSAAELKAAARQLTGIHDVADADIDEYLERLVASLNADAQLSETGASAIEQRVMRILSNRLRMRRDFREHPEITDEKIIRPRILTGGARTGSTKLHELMAASGDFKYITFWQGHTLATRSGDRSEDTAARIREADEYLQWFFNHAPQAKRIHDYHLYEPEEDTLVYEHASFGFFTAAFVFIPSFMMWFVTQDFRDQIAFFKQSLQYLQWQFHDGDTRPWVIKFPAYQGKEAMLREAFTDGVMVTTHRDPVATVISSASLFTAYHKAYSDASREMIQGQMMVEGLAASMQSFVDVVDQHPDLKRLDLQYAELVQAPERAIEKIYAYADQPMTDRARDAMRNWERDHAQHKYGAHKYLPEDFGLTRDVIETKCKPYIDRYRQYF